MKKSVQYFIVGMISLAVVCSQVSHVWAKEDEEPSYPDTLIQQLISTLIEEFKSNSSVPVISYMEATDVSLTSLMVDATIECEDGLSLVKAEVYEKEKKIKALEPEFVKVEDGKYMINFSVSFDNPNNEKKKLTVKLWSENKMGIVSEEKTIEVETPEKKFTVCIDPGHQGQADYGKEPVGPGSSTQKTRVAAGTAGCTTGVPESQVNLEVCLKLEKELLARGYNVVMCRTSQDVSISNAERAQVANNSNADIFIRVHCNATGEATTSLQGTSTYAVSPSNPYNGNLSEKSQILANLLLENTCASAGSVNRGMILRDDLSGSNWSQVPVALIELGFLTNSSEDQLLNSDSYQQKLAIGMANGIDAYFEQ